MLNKCKERYIHIIIELIKTLVKKRERTKKIIKRTKINNMRSRISAQSDMYANCITNCLCLNIHITFRICLLKHEMSVFK